MPRSLEINPTEKQYEAWQALNDPKIHDIYFGGGAGGGKSWLGCESRIVRAYAYPGYKSFIARNELTRLMASAYITFTKVAALHRLEIDKDWHLNGKYNFIEFANGSRIDLLDVAFKPSDPMYERLGSLEYTDAGWFEEAGEMVYMAIDILRSRGGRHLNLEYGIEPDSLYTFNPNKGWVRRVHKEAEAGMLPPDAAYIQSLYRDNPYTVEIYGKQLDRIKDKAMKQRLKEGSFDYDDNPAQLMNSDAISDLRTNVVDEGDKFLVIDVARLGVDKTVFFLFKGMKLYGVRVYHKQTTDVTASKARTVMQMERIPFSHTIADEDGVGGGVVDQLKGIKGFVGNSTAHDNPETHKPENYANLRSQCYYKLAELVNDHGIAIDMEEGQFVSEVDGITEEVFLEMLYEELEAILSKSIDKDQKQRVIPKEEIKEVIGRSPDFSDTLMMRMRFLYKYGSGKAMQYVPKHTPARSLVNEMRGIDRVVINRPKSQPRIYGKRNSGTL